MRSWSGFIPFWGLLLDLFYSGMWEQEWAELHLYRHLVSKSRPTRTLEVNHQTSIAIWPRSDAFLSNLCCKWFPRKTLCSIINLSCLPKLSGDARCPFSGERRKKHFLNIFWGIIGVKETGGYHQTSRRRDFSTDTKLCRNNPFGRLVWVISVINAVHLPPLIFLFVWNDPLVIWI